MGKIKFNDTFQNDLAKVLCNVVKLPYLIWNTGHHPLRCKLSYNIYVCC